MVELIIFCILMVIAIGLGMWYSFHRQAVYDEIFKSIRRSLETIADCSVDVSCAVDTFDIEGEHK